MVGADIGAKAYANSVPEHSFSTQEVILSMLQHDQRFRHLLAAEAHAAGRDPMVLEWAMADTYRSFKEHGSLQYGAKRREAYRLTSYYCHNNTFGVDMIIPSNYPKMYQIALKTLYHYWGIPCSLDSYRK